MKEARTTGEVVPGSSSSMSFHRAIPRHGCFPAEPASASHGRVIVAPPRGGLLPASLGATGRPHFECSIWLVFERHFGFRSLRRPICFDTFDTMDASKGQAHRNLDLHRSSMCGITLPVRAKLAGTARLALAHASSRSLPFRNRTFWKEA